MMSISANVLDALLKLPADERLQIAMALWESLEDTDREEAFTVSPELVAELDRRWAEHVADPSSAIPWEVVERELRGKAKA
jgi:putative addiction module component (TIGR02574 family)